MPSPQLPLGFSSLRTRAFLARVNSLSPVLPSLDVTDRRGTARSLSAIPTLTQSSRLFVGYLSVDICRYVDRHIDRYIGRRVRKLHMIHLFLLLQLKQNDTEVWSRPLSNSSVAVLLFNRNANKVQVIEADIKMVC